MSFIEVAKGVKVFAQSWGAGGNIVFIHGFPFNHRMFEYQMHALAKRDYRVIGIDLRGFGQSDKPWEGNEYDRWAADIGKVISELRLRDAMLVGYSLGGALATHHLARFMDTRVARLALVSAPVPSAAADKTARESFNSMIEEALADHQKFLAAYREKIFNTPVSPEYAEWLRSMGSEISLRATLRMLEELRDRDLRPALGNIRIPTRIFHGELDRIVPIELAEEGKKMIKNASLVRFEKSGHGLFWDEKDKLADELARFAREALVKAA